MPSPRRLITVGVVAAVVAACAGSSTAAPAGTSSPAPTVAPSPAAAAPTPTAIPPTPTPTTTPAPAPTLAPNETLATKIGQLVGTWQLADFANAPYYIEFKPDGTYVGSYEPPTTAPFDIAGTDAFDGTTFHMKDSTSGQDTSCAGFVLAFNVIVGTSGGKPSYLSFRPLNDACVVHEGGQSLSRADLYSRRDWAWVKR